MNAHEQYVEKRKMIENEIIILKQKLKAMDMEEKKDSKNYGYVGNCGHILKEIENINYDFMKRL